MGKTIKAMTVESPYCYDTRMFGDSAVCPNYDGTESMEPKCREYHKNLEWTISGKVLKCKSCLDDCEVIKTAKENVEKRLRIKGQI